MSVPLLLVLLVALAYGAAQIAFQWLGRRHLIVSGAEYLVLGILLGPQVSGLLSRPTLLGFAPFMTLALGWMGASVGMRLYLPLMIRVRGPVYRVAFVQSLLTLGIVTGASMLVFMYLLDQSPGWALAPSLVLGAVATASATVAVDLVAERVGRRGPVVRQLEVAVGMDAVIAIAALASVLALNHVGTPGLARSPTAVEWLVISVAIGVVSGALFHLFLGDERNPDRLFIALAGAIVFLTGAASYLQLSPLLPGLLLGCILVNTSRSRNEIAAVLTRVERPLYFVLLFCGGALWTPSTSAWVLPVVVFLALRVLAKIGGARLAARSNDMLPVLGLNWGWALIGQGGLALAIAFNYLTEPNAVVPNIVFTAAIASILFTDVFSARLVGAVVGHGDRRAAIAVQTPPAAAPAEPASQPAAGEVG